ncbi:MAG TPA: alkaline phosphatase family protein [Actinomycetota bacterium]|nr:alkaline phosphatase family protein [Actinomycetota bacterium]
MNKVLMLGLDGVGYPMLEPAFAAGHMPNLNALLDRGASGVLESTIPPYTPPGWTSIFTGVNPGRHGIFGFTLGNIQRSPELVSLGRVQAPAIWNALNAQGIPVGLFNIPMTYPAPAVQGFSVSGMLTPEGGGATPDNFTYPESLADDIASVVESYEIDIEVDYENDWRSTIIEERLSRNLAVKRAALSLLLDRHRELTFLFAVLEAPDRLMHVHYKYIDPTCEHFGRPEAEPIRERIWQFFDEMDDMIGDLLAWAGSEGYVVTMSDHGFGPKDKSVNMNVALREWGLLATSTGAIASSQGARRLARRAKKILPKTVWKRAKSAAHGTIDWERTKAFSAPIPQQGIYINLKGREPNGIVDESEYEAVRAEIIERLHALVDPDDGRPVVDRVYRREEVMTGPVAAEAPDLFPVCRAYSYELSDGLYSPDVLDDYRDLPRGFHHVDGIFGIQGPGIEPTGSTSDTPRAVLYDIMPTALYLAGAKIPDVDGRVLTELLPATMLAEREPKIEALDLPNAGEGAAPAPYSAEEEAQIEESLRNLGYL